MLSTLFSSPTTALLLSSFSKRLSLTTTIAISRSLPYFTSTMSIHLQTHAFAGNPLLPKTLNSSHPLSAALALDTLKSHLLDNSLHSSVNFKVLPFRKGRPLASSSGDDGDSVPNWHLGWIGLADCKVLLGNSGVELNGENLVFLGSRSEEDEVYWAVDVSGEGSLVTEFGTKQFCFIDLRTLMVATDWTDERAMADLAIAGHYVFKLQRSVFECLHHPSGPWK